MLLYPVNLESPSTGRQATKPPNKPDLQFTLNVQRLKALVNNPHQTVNFSMLKDNPKPSNLLKPKSLNLQKQVPQ